MTKPSPDIDEARITAPRIAPAAPLIEREKDARDWSLLRRVWPNPKVRPTYEWWHDGGDRWENGFGGYYPKRPTDKDEVVEVVRTDDYDKLPHWKAGIGRAPMDSDSGWLDREGRFYPCRHQEHDVYACLILRQDVKDLENAGWVRIYDDEQWAIGDRAGLRLSEPQRKFLIDRQHTLEEWD